MRVGVDSLFGLSQLFSGDVQSQRKEPSFFDLISGSFSQPSFGGSGSGNDMEILLFLILALVNRPKKKRKAPKQVFNYPRENKVVVQGDNQVVVNKTAGSSRTTRTVDSDNNVIETVTSNVEDSWEVEKSATVRKTKKPKKVKKTEPVYIEGPSVADEQAHDLIRSFEKPLVPMDQLSDLVNKTGLEQYKWFVNNILEWNLDDKLIIQNGPLTGKNVNDADVNTDDVVPLYQDLDKGIYRDWDLDELKEAYGDFTKVGDNSIFQDLQTLKNAENNWHVTPMNLGLAQEYLERANEIDDFIKMQEEQQEKYDSGEYDNSYDDYHYKEQGLSPEKLKKLEKLRDKFLALGKKHYKIAITAVSPIALDMDGDGKIRMTSVEDGVMFDIDGDGTKEQVAWTQKNGDNTDGWLVLDRNNNGTIDNGKELFGNQHNSSNGFEELAKNDTNQDGKIDANDRVFADLKIWQDKNHDGISQASELVSLEEAGIESINVTYDESTEKDAFGNELRQQSSFVRTLERAREISQKQGITQEEAREGVSADIWVQIDQVG